MPNSPKSTFHFDNSHFGPLLGYCDHQAHKHMDRKLKQYDISPVQCRSLIYLGIKGGTISQKELENHLMVKPSTVNGVVSRMENKGLVSRFNHPDDARCRMISLTDSGRRFIHEFHEITNEVNTLMEQGFSDEELSLFMSFLERVVSNLHMEEQSNA